MVFVKVPNLFSGSGGLYEKLGPDGLMVYLYLLRYQNYEGRISTTPKIINSILNLDSNSGRATKTICKTLDILVEFELANVEKVGGGLNGVLHVEIVPPRKKWFRLYKRDFKLIDYGIGVMGPLLMIMSSQGNDNGYVSISVNYMASKLKLGKERVASGLELLIDKGVIVTREGIVVKKGNKFTSSSNAYFYLHKKDN